MIVAAGVTAFTAAVVYVTMSPAAASGHCVIDPAFGSCAEATN
ncbi:hypothetical protein ACGFK1_14585 [Mycobacterium sp. NPDC048908]